MTTDEWARKAVKLLLARCKRALRHEYARRSAELGP